MIDILKDPNLQTDTGSNLFGILDNFFLHEVESKVTDMARLDLVGVLYSCNPALKSKAKYTILLMNMIKLSRTELQGIRKDIFVKLWQSGLVLAI